MILSVSFDFFRAGEPYFGMKQLAGFVVSAIIAMVGMRKIALLRSRIFDKLFLLVYLAGIFFMGLRHHHHKDHWPNSSSSMLQDHGLSFSDVFINIFGFVPLGYLMISFFLSGDRRHKKINFIIVTIAACLGVSLLIELSQYYLPGRVSSLPDVMFNGLVAFGCFLFYLLENIFSRDN